MDNVFESENHSLHLELVLLTMHFYLLSLFQHL